MQPLTIHRIVILGYEAFCYANLLTNTCLRENKLRMFAQLFYIDLFSEYWICNSEFEYFEATNILLFTFTRFLFKNNCALHKFQMVFGFL